MMIVDQVTGWFEQHKFYRDLNACTCQKILHSVQLSRYPRPKEIGFNIGSEFKTEFRDLCANMGLKQCSSNAWNPQLNAILERIHQVLADVLVTFYLEGTYIDVNKEDSFDEYLTVVLYVIRSSYHQSHGHSPAQLVFGRDMFSPVSVDTDWNAIRENKQPRINKNNAREKFKTIPHPLSLSLSFTFTLTTVLLIDLISP